MRITHALVVNPLQASDMKPKSLFSAEGIAVCDERRCCCLSLHPRVSVGSTLRFLTSSTRDEQQNSIQLRRVEPNLMDIELTFALHIGANYQQHTNFPSSAVAGNADFDEWTQS
jgi:hypothetical protein